MDRQTLRITIVLGMLVTLLGGTGIFATFSDRATTGQSDVTSGTLGKAADLKLAAAQPQDPMNSGPFICDPYADDLVTPVFTFTATQGNGNERFFCLENAGSSPVDVSLSAIDLTDVDVDCTGDESAFGDTTCGAVAGQGPQPGELSPNLVIETDLYDCMTGAGIMTPGVPDFSASLSDLGTTPTALHSLAAGAQICLRERVFWRPATPEAAQVSQSDEATWKFAYDGVVPAN